MRAPAVSRMQKIHNVDVALTVCLCMCIFQCRSSSFPPSPFSSCSTRPHTLQKHGCPSTVQAKDIVEGHRERTLALLWQIISVFQVEELIDAERLRKEIASIKSLALYKYVRVPERER
jgi:abnormal spindle-like microcephaly-associated protein